PAGRPGLAGLVFQGPSLLPPLDVTENIALPLLLAGCDEIEARERVAVALLLAARPRLILADEPTGQLDSAHAAQVAGLLLGTASRLGAGLVLATHDLTIARRLPVRWQ